jgi:hypothetical protein
MQNRKGGGFGYSRGTEREYRFYLARSKDAGERYPKDPEAQCSDKNLLYFAECDIWIKVNPCRMGIIFIATRFVNV